jgi:hypothetical protein
LCKCMPILDAATPRSLPLKSFTIFLSPGAASARVLPSTLACFCSPI